MVVDGYEQWLWIFDCKDIKIFFLKENHYKIETRNDINIHAFRYETKQLYLIYLSQKDFKDNLESLLLENKNNPHYISQYKVCSGKRF